MRYLNENEQIVNEHTNDRVVHKLNIWWINSHVKTHLLDEWDNLIPAMQVSYETVVLWDEFI